MFVISGDRILPQPLGYQNPPQDFLRNEGSFWLYLFCCNRQHRKSHLFCPCVHDSSHRFGTGMGQTGPQVLWNEMCNKALIKPCLEEWVWYSTCWRVTWTHFQQNRGSKISGKKGRVCITSHYCKIMHCHIAFYNYTNKNLVLGQF